MIMMASKYAGIHPGLGASQYFILIYTERRNNWKLPSIHKRVELIFTKILDQLILATILD